MSTRPALSPAAKLASATARRAAARQRALQRHRPRVSRLLAWLLAAWLGHAGLALAQVAPGALPSGGQVMVGSGQLQLSPNLLVIQQNSNRLGLDWQSFNIGSGATVEFRQPGAGSVALNRVVGNSGSEIYGQLKANGQVFLTNPNGVLFAPGSKVDVGGLVASTLDLSQQDFADGRYVFNATGAQGRVVNQGSLNASAGGYLALFGHRVDNQGDISVDAGSVVLASGRAATVSISGSGLISAVVSSGTLPGSVDNSGRITADGGIVTLSAKSAQDIAASLVNNSGIVRANTLVEKAGEIWITGDHVAQTGTLQAAAPNGGDGGRIMVIGDMKHGRAGVSGTIDTSSASAKGGFVETSAATVNIADGARVVTHAAGGQPGMWLIDPNDFTIAASGGNISGVTLSTNLGGSPVTIATANQGTAGGNGDIFVNDAVSWSANLLTLSAERNIAINGAMTGSGTAKLALEYGQGAVAAGNSSGYSVNVPVTLPTGTVNDARFSTKLGSNGAITTFAVITDLAGLQAIDGNATALATNYAVGATIDASASAAANGGLGFNPIGNEAATAASTTNSFSGQFDGLGNTISGLTIARPTSLTVGLFANTNNAQIRNLTLTGSAFSGSQYAGGVVGFANAATTLSKVQAGGAVTTASVSTAYAGGLVGQFATTGTITQSITSGTVTGRSSVGGLVGYGGTGTVSDSSSSANVTATAGDAGGLMGRAGGAVSNNSASGTVSGTSDVGGLIGIANGTGAVTGSSATGSVNNTLTTGTAGGLIGTISSGAVTDGTASGAVSGGTSTGGLIGSFSSSTASITNGTATGNVTGSSGGETGGLVGIATGTGSLSNSSATGNVSAPTNGDAVGGLAGQFSMTGGIVNSGAGAAAAGPNAATTVSGGAYTGGVVGWYNSATALVNDASNTIAFRGSSVTGSTWVGGLVGYMNTTAVLTITGPAAGTPLATQVIATGTSGSAGVLAGRTNGVVSGFTASGTVSSAGTAGGLVGTANGAGGFTNVSASGAVTSTGTGGSVGGLVGSYTNSGSLNNASASGTVQGGSGSGALTGGLVGNFSSAGSIVNAQTATTSTVTGGGDTGGLVGQATGTGTSAITSATVRGTVTGASNVGYVGGLVGDFSQPGGFSGVTVEGQVSGGNRTGGLVGHYNSAAAITGGSYTPASVAGGTWVGGIVGYVSSTAAISGAAPGTPWVIGTNVTAAATGGAAGGLAGRTAGAVANVTATGSVNAVAGAGGVVGQAEGAGGLSTLRATGTVTSTSTTANVGGVTGYTSNSGSASALTGTGNVSGGRYTGGVIGYWTSNATAQNLRGEGTVAGAGDAGGLIGFATGSGSLSSSDALANVSSSDPSGYSVGGAVGYFNMTGGLSAVSAAGTVSGGANTGGVVGYYNPSAALTASSLSSVNSAAKTVTGAAWVGGLIGYSNASSISGLSSAAAVTATGSSGSAGGLVGRTVGAVSSSSSSGNVVGVSEAGGLVGQADGSGAFTDVSATGTVRANTYAGGLVGQYNSSGAITRGTASGNVTTGNTGGGLVGYHGGGVVTDSHAIGSVTAVSDNTVYLGGLIGQFGPSCYYCNIGYLITGSTASGAVRADSSGSYIGGLVGLMYSGSIGGNSRATGTVTAVDTINGVNGNEFAGGLVGYFGYYDNTGTISNSTAGGAVTSGYYAGGLVGYHTGGAISDSSATGAVSGVYMVGGLIGSANFYGAISNVSASGAVTSTGTSSAYIGGLIGYLQMYTGAGLSNGFASGNVSSPSNSSYAGGLVGYLSGNSSATGVFNDSAATGNVTGGYMAGGLVGYFYNYYGTTALLNSHASGNVTSSGSSGGYAGGLVGYYFRQTTTGRADDITNSYATGQVSGSQYVGGLAGDFTGRVGIVGSYATGDVVGTGYTGTTYLGGLVGSYYAQHASTSVTATLRESYATGGVSLASTASLITSTTVYAGGLVGYLSGSPAATTGIANSYATGAVTLQNLRGRLNAGGLLGYNDNQIVTRSYASGAVSATGGTTRAAGGLVAARSTGAVTESYWNLDSTGQAASVGGGTGVSDANALLASTYSGWDLSTTGTGGTVWRIYDAYTAPLLSRFLTPLTLSLADASKAYDGTRSFGNATLVGSSGPVAYPDRIFAATPAADVGSYTVAAAGVYSVQNGYDLTVTGSATLTVTPRALTLAGLVADKVYDGLRTATLLGTAQPFGIVAGEDLAVNLASASAVFDTKDTGQNKAVTVSGLTLADGIKGKALNYNLASATSTTASITPKALNVGGFTATDRAYDGSTTVAVAAAGGSITGTIVGDDVTADVSAVTSGSIASKNVGTAKSVTVLGTTLTGADAGNYSIGGVDSVTVNITPRTLTANGLTASNREYDNSINVTVSTAGATLGGAVSGDAVQLQSTSVTGTTADKNAGNAKTVTVAGSGLTTRLRGTDAGNYTVQDATTTVNIVPRTLYFYVSNTSSTNKPYDGTAAASVSPYMSNNYGQDDITLSWNTPTYSDKNVAYTAGGAVTSKTITVSGATLTGTDAGNYAFYNTSTTTSGTISPLALTVTGVAAVNRAYNGTRDVVVNVAGAAIDAAVLGGDTVTLPSLPSSGTLTGTIADKNVGSNRAVTLPGFTLGGTDAGNYTLTGSGGVTVNVTRKDLTAVYTVVDKVYDGQPNALVSVGSADIVAGDSVRFYADQTYCTYCGYAYYVTPGSTPSSYSTSKDAGTGKTVVITTNGLYSTDANNYSLLNTTATVTGNITPKGITPVFTGVNKVYDGSTTATVNVNTSASGIVSGDAVSLARTATFDTKNVGSGKSISITDIAFSGANATNYTLAATTATTTAAITPKALSVQGVTATDRQYDGTTSVALVVGTLAAGGVIGSEAVSLVPPSAGLSTGTIANKNVGTDKPVTLSGLTLSGVDAGNYTIDGSQGVAVNITPRQTAVTYTGVDRVYNGGVSAQVMPAAVQLIPGDTLSFTQNAIYTGLDARNVGSNKPVSITGIVMGGTDTANYSLLNTTASTTAGITPKGITVFYTGLGRVYSGLADTSANVVGSSTGLVAGDLVSFTQTAVFQGDGAAGVGKAVDVSNIALGGTQGANYSLLATTATTTATITPRLLGVTGVTATHRVYDGTRTVSLSTAGATVLPAGVLAGDTVSVVLPSGGITTGTVATKDAGNNKDVTITGLTLSGASAANYSVGGASGLTVNITPRSLTAVYGAASRVYDGTTLATVSATSADILAGDLGAIGIVASGVFSGGKNVGVDKSVTVSAGFLNGVERNNYTLINPTGSALASITPKTLTPGYLGGTRVYDGGVSAPVNALGTGVVSGDTVLFSQTAAFTGAGAKDVGGGKAVAISDVVLGGTDAGNYTLASTSAAATASVTPKPISIDGLTGATATDRPYDRTRMVEVLVATSGTISPSSADIEPGDVVSINLPAGGITTGTMANKNAGNNKSLVVDGLSLTGADAGNYLVTATTGITVNITRRLLSAQYAGVNRVYDGSALATVTGSSLDILDGDMLAITGGGVFTGTGAKNVANDKPVSVLSGSLGGVDAANYALINTTGSTTANITPRPLTPTYIGLAKVYDGFTTAQVSASNTGFISGDAVTLDQTALFTGDKNVGQNKAIQVSGMNLSGSDAANYQLTIGSASTSGSITPKPLRIDGLTGVSATDRAYDGTNLVSVLVTSTGPITPNASDLIPGDVVTVSAPGTGNTSGTMLDKSVGSAKPVAVAGLGLGGADAANYSITATSGVTVNITPRTVTAVYSAFTRVYDGTAVAAITGSSGDFIASDLINVGGSGVFSAGKNVGTNLAVSVLGGALTGADAVNYSLVNPTGNTTGSITPRAVSVSYLGGSRVYDGSASAPVSATAAGFIGGDDISVGQTAVFTGSGAKNVGNNKAVAISGITLGGADALNYALTGTTALTTASVTPRPLRIEGFSGVVATDRVYDGSTAVAVSVLGSGTIAANAADVVPGDDLSVVAPPTGTSAGTMADKNAGSNKPVIVSGVTLSGADAGNYAVAAATGVTVNIAPKPLTAAYAAASRVYDGTDLATISGSSADIVAGDLLTIAGNGLFAGPGGKNFGIGKTVTVTGGSLGGADAANYSLLNTSASLSADITPRTVTANYTGGSRVYDGSTLAPVNGTLDGLIAGDTVTFGQTALFSGSDARNVGSGKAVVVSGIALQGSDAANYSLLATSASTTASITPRPLNISGLSGLQAVNRVYDGTRDVQITGSLVVGGAAGDVIGGDDVSINVPGGSISAGTMVDKSAGNGKSVAVSGLSLSGADAPNYQITGVAGLTVNIAPRPVVLLGVSAVNRVYDGSTVVGINSAGGSLSGVLSGDDLQLLASGVTGSMADKHVGSGKTVSVTGLSFAGADVGNYRVDDGGGLRVDITPRSLVATATAADKLYDGSNLAAVTLLDDRVGSDTLSVTHGSATFAGKDAGASQTVSVGGLALTGTDAGNYLLLANALTTTASINRAPLTVSANSLSKVYGESVNLTGAEFTTLGLVAGESLGLVTLASDGTASTAAVAGAPYALAASDARGGNFNPANYTLTYTSGVLTVTPRPLTIASNSVVRSADEANPASFGFSTNVGGLVSGDSIASVVLNAPAGSATAAGGSIFELVPSGAVFGAGQASNYALSYDSGLLVVLPRPPRVDDVDPNAGNTGQQGFAVQVDQAELERALDTLQRSASVVAQAGADTAFGLPLALRDVDATAAEISVAVAGDSRRITLPALLRLPLISFDPTLRRLIFSGPAAGSTPPSSTAP